MELFLRNLLCDEENELHNRSLHVSGLYQDYRKANIEDNKVNIEESKVNIGLEKANIDVSDIYGLLIKEMPKKTVEHIQKIFTEFGIETVFGRSDMQKITKGYHLPAKYIIHTVGSVWDGGNQNEAELLANCYKNSIGCASAHGCKSVAVPAISTGVYGYPKGDAAKIAVKSIVESTKGNVDPDFEVWLVAFDSETEKLYHEAIAENCIS